MLPVLRRRRINLFLGGRIVSWVVDFNQTYSALLSFPRSKALFEVVWCIDGWRLPKIPMIYNQSSLGKIKDLSSSWIVFTVLVLIDRQVWAEVVKQSDITWCFLYPFATWHFFSIPRDTSSPYQAHTSTDTPMLLNHIMVDLIQITVATYTFGISITPVPDETMRNCVPCWVLKSCVE